MTPSFISLQALWVMLWMSYPSVWRLLGTGWGETNSDSTPARWNVCGYLDPPETRFFHFWFWVGLHCPSCAMCGSPRTHSFCSKNRWQHTFRLWARCTNTCSGRTWLTSRLNDCSTSVYEADSEDHLKTSSGAECGCAGSKLCQKHGTHITTSMWTALLIGAFLGAIQDAGGYL